MHRLTQRGPSKRPFTPLSAKFLATAALILVSAMLALGFIVDDAVSRNITQGIAETAAASIDAMVADELAEIGPQRPLPPSGVTSLDTTFAVANNSRATKLLQIRLREVDGRPFYESLGGLVDSENSAPAVDRARSGEVTVVVERLPLGAVGPLSQAPVAILKIVTPVHDSNGGAIIATAELYFSARSVVDLISASTWRVWEAVALLGLVAISALFLLVRDAARTITSQRAELATSLFASQELANENRRLRQHASVANERLLAQVGSDLHDGPLQLLTLLILNLSRKARKPESDAAIAREAMDELRSISAGLMLPELSAVSLRETVLLAVARHQELTGSSVRQDIGPLPESVADDVKVCVYRVIREGLSNAQRYGREGSITVAAALLSNGIEIIVSNEVDTLGDGEATTDSRPRLGLAGMRSRVDALGGELSFETTMGVARLRAYLPPYAASV